MSPSPIPATSPLTPAIILAIFFGLGFLAALTQAQTPKPKDQNNTIVQASSLNKHTETFVFFFTQVFGDRDKTRIVVPFSYDTPDAPILFVGFSPDTNSPRIGFLLSHPQLNSLTWPRLTSGTLNLYQKTPTYQSVADFLNQPPDLSRVIIDDLISKQYSQFKDTGNTEEPFNLDNTDYILTTFIPLENSDGVYYYENIIDTNGARLTEANQIEWFIRAPHADAKNPYKLGQISVDYLD